MREAVGGSLLMNLVVIFTAIVILFFVSILSYSKAYGVKNRIINVMEKYQVYSVNAKSEINADLKNIGYKSSSKSHCDDALVKRHLSELGINSATNLNKDSYNYCIYKVEDKTTSGYYFLVVTFVSFEFPVIGDVISYPVYGETRIIGKDYSY